MRNGKQLRGHVERDAVELGPEHHPQAHVDVPHQRERGQEMAAELSVSGPRTALDQGFEGQRVDEHRSSVVELDVVRRRVAQRHAVLECHSLDLQRGLGGVAQLSRTPLERVGDERDGVGLDHQRGGVRLGRRHGNLDVGDQQPTADQRVIQTGLEQRVVVPSVPVAHLAVEHAVASEDEASGVTERARQPLAVTHAAGRGHAASASRPGRSARRPWRRRSRPGR